jgi:hypothetical protein
MGRDLSLRRHFDSGISTLHLTHAGALAGIAAGGRAFAQVGIPADKQEGEGRSSVPPKQAAQEIGRLRSWELPPIEVQGVRPSKYRDEDRVGTNVQPRWTATRRFSETRVYVIPSGTFDFEHWLIPEVPKDGHTDITKQYEVEIGLPNRMQLDLYLVSDQLGNTGPIALSEEKLEMY